MTCVKFTVFCDLPADLQIRLATLHKSVRKFWFCKLALTCADGQGKSSCITSNTADLQIYLVEKVEQPLGYTYLTLIISQAKTSGSPLTFPISTVRYSTRDLTRAFLKYFSGCVRLEFRLHFIFFRGGRVWETFRAKLHYFLAKFIISNPLDCI